MFTINAMLRINSFCYVNRSQHMHKGKRGGTFVPKKVKKEVHPPIVFVSARTAIAFLHFDNLCTCILASPRYRRNLSVVCDSTMDHACRDSFNKASSMQISNDPELPAAVVFSVFFIEVDNGVCRSTVFRSLRINSFCYVN